MKTIIHEDFLLQNDTAQTLYHQFAKDLPIIDYHCHLSPARIQQNQPFTDVGEMMLDGDHYKWRIMRAAGIPESLITGNGTWEEKFRVFASALPLCIGNPLYHWTHLELKRYFGIEEILNEESAERIYRQCNQQLQEGTFTPQELIRQSKVEVLCTTDDPMDTLEHHRALEGFDIKVLPTFRPDKAVDIHKPSFLPYMKKAGISDYEELKLWLKERMDHFQSVGCCLADLGLDFVPWGQGDARAVFQKVLAGNTPTRWETELYMTDLVLFLGQEFADRGFCMQIHMNTLRNNSTRAYRHLGPDTGYDSMGEAGVVQPLARILDGLAEKEQLPKTILYSLNPKDNLPLATLMGCFQENCKGKLQLGSGWWFNDQKLGMEQQMQDLAGVGVLGCFVGMLTDSRSFLSYPRHEYFRRILCNLLGTWVEQELYPKDLTGLGQIVRGICYENAKAYFNF